MRNITTVALALATLVGCSGGTDPEPATTTVVGSPGGSASGLGGAANIVIPPGALAGDVEIAIAQASGLPSDPRALSATAVSLGPDGQVFNSPVQLQLKYDPSKMPTGAMQRLLWIHKLVNGIWVPLSESTVDMGNRTVSANISGFSTYAVLTAGIPAPAEYVLTTMNGEPLPWVYGLEIYNNVEHILSGSITISANNRYRFHYAVFFPGEPPNNQYHDVEWTGVARAMPYGFAMCTPDSYEPQYAFDCSRPPADYRIEVSGNRLTMTWPEVAPPWVFVFVRKP